METIIGNQGFLFKKIKRSAPSFQGVDREEASSAVAVGKNKMVLKT